MPKPLLPTLIISSCLLVFTRMDVTLSGLHDYCKCVTLKTREIISNKEFNRLAKYDTSTFPTSDFYTLNKDINKELWYRDIENIDTTKFTRLWNDYSPFNYHASQNDFVKHYTDKKDIEIAFQFGPNEDLWAYHIFIVKRVGCCFLVTRSYFRHARFTYKAFSILNKQKLDSLYSILKAINTSAIPAKEEFNYSGYFVDNRNKKRFFIDFEKEIAGAKDINGGARPKPEVEKLFDFLDKKIN